MLSFPEPRRDGRARWIVLAAAVVLLLVFGRSICSLIVDYLWWGEMGQVNTWLRASAYLYATNVAEWLIAFLVLWIGHARGLKYAGERIRDNRIYSRLVTVALVLVAMVISASSMSGWVVARYIAGSGVASTWTDPVFGRPLGFYFFELPFYNGLVGFVETLAIAGALAYYLTARGWQIRREFPGLVTAGRIDLDSLKELGRLETGMLQALMAGFLVALAVNFWLDRYSMLYSDHGNLLVGIDYIQQNIGLPLQYAKAAAAILAAVLVLARKRRWALACAIVLVFDVAIPPLVSSLYVKPNELLLERPYLQRHIEATRSAFGLAHNVRETQFDAHKEGRIDFKGNEAMLDNVRLWDWHAFHDTLSQTQPLRPYAYADTDVDRYMIDGKLRQTLLAPRELDLNQLGEAQNSWINFSTTYTHGYGLVLAEASRISPTGLPELLVRDAPVQVMTPSLKVTRPEIYFGEASHEPVFAPTKQLEFNYPATPDVKIHYDGKGGFNIASLTLRTVAAIAEGDWNIFLSDAITSDSRMMIHRKVLDRLGTLAEFVRWDHDPYMVITESGRLTWIVDGYMTSDAHPYSREVQPQDEEPFNYIRNSVKATIDAYDGSVKLYVFDAEDPLIQAYQRLFPDLFVPASEMPGDLRAHTRSPEDLFRIQAEVYRTYHMRDPESFYNRAELWDLATSAQGQSAGGGTQSVTPVYMVMTLPGETAPEFVLTTYYTPRGKQNLIALMVARCDGPHLGEVVFLELPKQEIISGPLQVDALVNQDQVISKDLTLWGQQGSQVLRPPILVLPIDNTFLYVEPIFIQAVQARMPQLQKVALVTGSTLVYEDTYEKALASLAAIQAGQPPPAPTRQSATETNAPAAPAQPAAATASSADARLNEIRMHFDRYKQLVAQGKLADAGKELEAIEAATKK
ncbi:MAG TPA: UPF0182 family protein [Bryobacteraceae bacterium]|jgi:hypothetical protein